MSNKDPFLEGFEEWSGGNKRLNDIRFRIMDSCGGDSPESQDTAKEIAFHLIDWLDDFYRLRQFFEHPDRYTDEQINDMLFDVLIHAPQHVAAAAKLHTGMPVRDVWSIGAVQENA